MPTQVKSDVEFFSTLFHSIAADLAMIMDAEVSFGKPEVAREWTRPAGKGRVHVSFRFLVHSAGVEHHGSVLVPLPDAITLAGHLMMMGPDDLAVARQATDLDRPMKEAMLEVGNFIAGAIDAVIRTWYPPGASCRSAGCQGVRADVRPAFPYEEGAELVVGRAEAQVAKNEPYWILLQLPAPPGA
jgi:hypothetical protein